MFPFRIAIIVYLIGILRKEKLDGQNDAIVIFSGAVLCLYLLQAICVGTVELAQCFSNDPANGKGKKWKETKKLVSNSSESSSDTEIQLYP